MASGEQRITIDRSPDEVWALVGDFGGIHTWMPGIASCTVEGDDRTLDMGGMQIVERQFSRDEAGRTLTYGIVGGGIPVDTHRATITVTAAGDGAEVVWAYEAEPDSMADVMGGAYGNALAAAKAKLEG